MSETGHKLSIYKRPFSQPVSTYKRYAVFWRLAVKGHSTIRPMALWLDNSKQSTVCSAVGLTGLPGSRPWLHWSFQWWWTGTHTWEEKLCSPRGPDSAHGPLDCRVKVWRRHRKHYADAALQHSVWSRRWCQATEACLLYEHVSSDIGHPFHQTWVHSRVRV